MSLPSADTLVPDALLTELSDRGQAIYAAKLQQKLEAEALHRFVAIHVDTEEYAVARPLRRRCGPCASASRRMAGCSSAASGRSHSTASRPASSSRT